MQFQRLELGESWRLRRYCRSLVPMARCHLPMIPFVPYPKVREGAAALDMEPGLRRRIDRDGWVATEKIHGAHLCLCSNGTDLRVAKRRAVLEPNESFFDYQQVIAPHVASVIRLAREVSDGSWVFVHGELFGGAYPAGESESSDGAVQTGVYYAPDIKFAVFDVVLAADHERVFLPFERVTLSGGSR